MKKLFILLITASFVSGASSSSPLDQDFEKDLKAVLEETIVAPRVKVRRDTTTTKAAGLYFTDTASIKFNDEESVVVPFSAEHKQRLKEVDSFVSSTKKWNENHLSLDLFVTVREGSDPPKLIEGTVYVQRDDGTHGATTKYVDFDIRPGNKNMLGYKIADFVSCGQSIPDMKYEFLDVDILRPSTDKEWGNNHGDRLALDILKTNPHLFFNLIRRTAHRADLKIMNMGVRYLSTYDACIPCFNKIFDARASLNDTLNDIARKQGFSIDPPLATSGFSTYSLFYSTRPYGVGATSTVTAKVESDRKYPVAYWGTEETTFNTFFKYRFPGPKYYLDLLEVNAHQNQQLNDVAALERYITIDKEVDMNPESIYHNCSTISQQVGQQTTGIPFEISPLTEKAPSN
jgi:hypothetical protein